MPEDLSRLAKALLPRYLLDAEIARGGMATVYAATDERMGRKVAVKVLRPELASGLASDRFEREISIAGGLSHRHLVPVYDCGVADGFLYYVMPFVEGETLREALDREGPFEVERALHITRDVAEGLAYAHAKGFVHRDIKPQNILLTGGYAVVTDFGVARALEVAAGDALTTEGVAVGTPAYMSPEQADGKTDVGASSDTYSLACVVYEMLTGAPPFHAGTFREMLARQLFGTIPSPREERPDLPRGAEHVIRRALAKLPEHRFDSVTAFVESLDAAATGDFRRPASETWAEAFRRPVVRWATVPVLALLIGLPVRSLLLARRAPSFEGRPASAVVLSFGGSGEGESGLARDVADAVTRQLNGWAAVRVVPRVSLEGTLFDLGLRGAGIGRVSDGIEVAKAFGVQALVVVRAQVSDDTAFVEATMFDAGTGGQVRQTFEARAPPDRVSELSESIARQILELDDRPLPLEELRHVSASPEALVQDAEGVRALESWRLGAAERSFRAAVDLDSTYAMAKHRLAQTLYWRTARAPEQLRTLGPEIAALSASAIAHSSGLPARDSLRIRAFFSFQIGDYEDARSRYRALVASDSTDVYAWLMLGSVEYRDDGLAAGTDGTLFPRSDLNTAIAAFTRAVRLQPTFSLGYGHLFDIYRYARFAIDRGVCQSFAMPRADFVAPWEAEALERRDFCLVPGDSLAWVRRDDRPDASGLPARRASSRLLDDNLRLLRRWASYDPTNPQPHDALYLALSEELARDVPAPPGRLDSLVAGAREEWSAALALRGDTTPGDLVTLGLLHLAGGDPERARALVERGLATATVSDSMSVASSANLFLALGQPLRAADLIASLPQTSYSDNPTTGALIPWGAGQTLVDRIRVLGASGVTGARVARELDSLRDLWASPDYSPEETSALHDQATMYLAIGLAFDDAALREWAADASDTDPVWGALVARPDDPVRAGERLDAALAGDSPALSAPSEAFLEGLVALRLERYDVALRRFAALDSMHPRLGGPDVHWALRPLSWFLRGEASEALGDRSAARAFYSRFTSRWAAADSAALPLLRRATERLDRLGGA